MHEVVGWDEAVDAAVVHEPECCRSVAVGAKVSETYAQVIALGRGRCVARVVAP
jgi:hypothetical protein